MEPRATSPAERNEDTKAFIRQAHARGVISRDVRERLEALADEISLAEVSSRRAQPEPVTAAPPASRPVPSRLPGVVPHRPETPSRPPASAPGGRPPMPVRQPVPTQPSTVPAARAARPPVAPPPARPSPPVPAPPTEPPGPSWAERAGERLRVAWSRLTADFAANSLIYLGVLLAVVVIFVFFAFGYFGEAVGVPSLRSLIFVAVPLVFFGLAWVLRNRVGLPSAADAVGLIGAAILPIMLSALFQDNSSWADRSGAGAWFPLSWIPDLDGPDRWYGYGIVGVICAAVYFALARRHRIYAYGVAPMLWAVAGALGLYWLEGMSGPQMLTVLVAIAVGLVAASRGRDSTIGRLLSAPTVRIGVVGAPFVFGFAILFAYEDAVRSGIAAPGLADLAHPGAAAAALLALIFAIASGATFVWTEVGPRTRDAMAVVLRVGAYATAGVAVLLALSFETSVGWVGAAMVAYGIGVAVVDRIVGGIGSAGVWIARGSIVVGAAVALFDPWAATVVWSSVLAAALARALVPSFREASGFLVPTLDTPWADRAALWIPAYVMVAGGVARLVDPVLAPTVFMTAAAAAVALQFAPRGLELLRSFAGFPATTYALSAAAVGAWLQLDQEAFTLLEIGVGLAVLTVIAATVTAPWPIRLPAVVFLANASAAAVAAHFAELGIDDLTFPITASLTATGLLLIGAAFVPRLSPWTTLHAVYGHGALVGAVITPVRSDFDVDALFLALSAVLGVSVVEALLAPRKVIPFIEANVTEPVSDPSLRQLPATVAMLTLGPWAILAADRLEWFTAEPSRFAIALASLGVVYAGLALRFRALSMTALATFLGYVAVAGSLGVSIGDGHVTLVALAVGAVSTFLIAVALRTPLLSSVSWAFVLGTAGVAYALAGVPVDVAHRQVGVIALGLAAASTGFAIWRRTARVRAWFATSAGVASIAMAASMALALPSADVLWPWAIAAAVVTAATVVVFRWRLLMPVVWAYLLVGYVDLLADAVRAEPAWLVPFGAAAIAVSAVLPGRRSRGSTDLAALSLASGLVVLASAVAMAVVEGGSGATLAWSALVVASIAAIRSEDVWLHAGVAGLVAAGLWEGDVWLGASLFVAAVVETVMAEVRRDRLDGSVLRWIATALWAATYVAVADWLDPTPMALVWTTLGIGIAASAIGGLVLAGRLRMPIPWVERWWLPVGALGQLMIVAAGVAGSIELATTEALFVWASAAAVEALIVGVVATVRPVEPGAWVSTALAGVSVALFSEAIGLEPGAVVFSAMATGAILSAVALGWWLSGVAGRTSMWMLPIGALGQAALVASMVQSLESFSEADATLVWAAIVWIEAALLGTAGTIKRLEPVVWASALFMGVGAALGVRGLGLEWLEVVWTTSILAIALLTVWLVSVVATESDRIRIWELPTAALAQASIVAAGTAATIGLPEPDAAMTWFVLCFVDALAIGVVASITGREWMTFGSAALAPVVVAAGIAAFDVGSERIGVWLGAFVVGSIVATVVTRSREKPLLGLWHVPTQILVGVFGAAAVISAWDILDDRGLLLLGASVSAVLAVHVMANRQWLRTFQLESEPIAAMLVVVSGVMIAASLRAEDEGWVLATLGITVAGAVASGIAGRFDGTMRTSWLMVGAGYSLTGLATASLLAGVPSGELGWVLVVVGGAFAAFAVTSQRAVVWHLAVMTWLAAALILVHEAFTLELHMTMLAVSVVLLTMLEVERIRLRHRGADAPDWMRVAEWVVMIIPLTLAVRDMVVVSTTYGVLLGAEGAALLAWGILTQTRRRAIVGLGAVTAAIVLSVMIPLIEGFDTNLSTGVWLIIGGVAAVAFITAGSVIEKYRTRIGDRLHHFGEIIERWN